MVERTESLSDSKEEKSKAAPEAELVKLEGIGPKHPKVQEKASRDPCCCEQGGLSFWRTCQYQWLVTYNTTPYHAHQ